MKKYLVAIIILFNVIQAQSAEECGMFNQTVCSLDLSDDKVLLRLHPVSGNFCGLRLVLSSPQDQSLQHGTIEKIANKLEVLVDNKIEPSRFFNKLGEVKVDRDEFLINITVRSKRRGFNLNDLVAESIISSPENQPVTAYIIPTLCRIK